jgi:hypothetical protein
MRTMRMAYPISLIPGASEALQALAATTRAILGDMSGTDDVVAALTEALRNPADPADPIPDRVWDLAAKHFDQRELAALLLDIVLADAAHRLGTATRQPKEM